MTKVEPVLAVDDPPIWVFDDAVSPGDCASLIEAARGQLRRAAVNRRGRNVVDPSHRTADVTFLGADHHACFPLVSLALDHTRARPSQLEKVQVVRYEAGGEYREHHDGLWPLGDGHIRAGGQRVWSFLLWLSTPSRGGRTTFPRLDLQFLPVAGRVIGWRNVLPDDSPDWRVVHAGEKVEAGEKWVAVLWVREHPRLTGEPSRSTLPRET